MTIFRLTAASDSRSTLLPALVGFMLSVLFWMAAEEARERLVRVEVDIESALKTTSRSNRDSEVQRLRERLDAAREERAAMVARLQTPEAPAMVRAKLVFDLRQKCEASRASGCTVRLAEDTIAVRSAASAAPPVGTASGAGRAGAATLADLGVQKARAIITGSFQKDELVDLCNKLNTDPNAYWRINGIVVRGSSFEIDVERHLMTTLRTAS